jgi:hypothetical protein
MIGKIGKFVEEYLVKDKDSFATLKELKEIYKMSDYSDGQSMSTFKTRLERTLGKRCEERKNIQGKYYRGVFMGFQIINKEYLS